MRQVTRLGIAALSIVVVAACGGSAASATQGPGAGQTESAGGGNPTEVPAQTEAVPGGGGGGGGGAKPAGWDQHGKVHIEISGPVSKNADYGFIPAGSIFGGAAGSSLNFAVEGTSEIVSILVGPEGKVVVSYGGEDFSAPGSECTTSSWNVGATSGSGSFDCQAAFAIIASGAMVQGVTIKGTFDAHV